MDYIQESERFLSIMKSPMKAEIINKINSFSHGEALVLGYLYKNSGQPVVPSDIAKYTKTSTARIATILNNLEDKNFITREISRQDRRKILVALTEKGRKQNEINKEENLQRLVKIFQAMGETSTHNFIDLFELFFEKSAEVLSNE